MIQIRVGSLWRNAAIEEEFVKLIEKPRRTTKEREALEHERAEHDVLVIGRIGSLVAYQCDCGLEGLAGREEFFFGHVEVKP
jgi:hypothetical protein